MIFTYSSTSITIKGTQSPYERGVAPKQNIMIAEDGHAYVYNRGWQTERIELNIYDSPTVVESVVTFLKTTVGGAERAFTYTPDAGINAGAGAGVSVSVRCISDQLTPIVNEGNNTGSLKITLRREV